jgi:hypothetical protein
VWVSRRTDLLHDLAEFRQRQKVRVEILIPRARQHCPEHAQLHHSLNLCEKNIFQ